MRSGARYPASPAVGGLLGEALKAVRWKSPHRLSLRDCDRDLYCRSGARLEDDIRRGFPRANEIPTPTSPFRPHPPGKFINAEKFVPDLSNAGRSCPVCPIGLAESTHPRPITNLRWV